MVGVGDSLSLIMALSTGSTAVKDGLLRRGRALMLAPLARRVRLSIPFVFGHWGSDGRSEVHRVAKPATTEAPTSTP